MSAILGILKVIGILLLVLLGILLLLIIILLFCPIFYKVAGARDGDTSTDGDDSLSIQISARWILGLLGIRYSYPEPGAVRVKLLCFTLYDSSKVSHEVSKATPTTEPAGNAPTSTGNEPLEAQATDTTAVGNDTPTDAGADIDNSPEISKPKKSLPDKLKDLYKEFQFYRDFWDAAETRELLKKVIYRCKKIVVSILPKKIEAHLLIGTGQPDTTGYVMAVYGILLPYLGSGVNVTADFENQVFEGHFKAKGHICIFTLLRHTLSVLLDKNLRIVYKRFKKHKAKIAAARTVTTDATSNSGK